MPEEMDSPEIFNEEFSEGFKEFLEEDNEEQNDFEENDFEEEDEENENDFQEEDEEDEENDTDTDANDDDDDEIESVKTRLEKREQAKKEIQELERERQAREQEQDFKSLNLTLSDSNNILSEIGLEEIPDLKIDFEGEEISLKEIAEDNPQVTALMKYFVTAVNTKSNDTKFDDIKNEYEDMKYWNTINSYHPGTTREITTDRFKEWMENQNEDINELANSGNPYDSIAVIDKYKRDMKSVSSNSVDTKKRTNTLRSPQSKRSASAPRMKKEIKNGMKGFKAGFDAATK